MHVSGWLSLQPL